MNIMEVGAGPHQASEVWCELLAQASVRVRVDQIANLRHSPGPGLGYVLPPNTLKHVDEQTVVALAAVLAAAAEAGLPVESFQHWGIVAAPCFLGRQALAAAVKRFAVEGAWGVSPHLIPHRSQHAVSGTLSQVLKIHGPNLGAGGGPGSVLEALRAGLGMLLGDRLPALWLVVTTWEQEMIPDEEANLDSNGICRGIAMALRSGCGTSAGRAMCFQPMRSEHMPCISGDNISLMNALEAALTQAGMTQNAIIDLQLPQEAGMGVRLGCRPQAQQSDAHHAWSQNAAHAAWTATRAGIIEGVS